MDGGSEIFGGHAVEAALGVEEAVGGEDVEVGMEDEVIAEGVDSGHGGEFPIGEVETGAERIAEGFGAEVAADGGEIVAFEIEEAPGDVEGVQWIQEQAEAGKTVRLRFF